MYPALAGGRIPAGIGPTPVVRARLSPNGAESGDPALQAWRANDGEGQALALRKGVAFFSS